MAKETELRVLSDAELDHVHGGTITPVTTQVNGGGNTPSGTANGVPMTTVNQNPSGFAPPGHN
jgi:hypothetical protein